MIPKPLALAHKVSLLLLLVLFFSPVAGQDYRHLRQPQTPKSYSSLEAWLGRAAELRTHILISTGLWPLPEKTPLNPSLSKPVEREGYSVQNVVLETLPGFYLTGNLYRPVPGQGPFPAVLSPHGHWKSGRLEDSLKASVPGRAINLALQGYVVFSYSMIGYNETKELFPHRFHERRHQLWGFSAMGLQLWNSFRAVDFLASLPEVDEERMGMSGASGGGTQTFMFTAIDPRIKVAAPVNMISAHFQGGCVCENAPLLRLNASNVEIGALAAPRPLLLVSTSGDWTKDTPEIEFPAIQAIYRLFGAEDRVANVHLHYEHNYNQESREAVYSWFALWLLKRDEGLREQAFQVEEDSTLSAQLPHPPVKLEELFKHFTGQAAGQIESFKPNNWRQIYDYRKIFGAALEHALAWGAAPSTAELEVFAPEGRTEASQAVLIVYPDVVGEAPEARELAEDYRQRGWLAFLLTPYPEGSTFSPPSEVQYWTTYNPTVSSRRVNEIRAAAREILKRPDVRRLDLVGLGETGPWVLLARAFLPEIFHTRVDFHNFQAEADEAFLHHLFIPLLRRAGDFKTTAAMIVPAPLTLWNMPEGPLRQWFRDVYRAAGAQELLHFEPRSEAALGAAQTITLPL
ncbi:acetylxylan esterase [Acidobacteria bacterium AH-259-O06]|nr:acetylxylan esterase [Acidobacteria bacterium AH-259-O06]